MSALDARMRAIAAEVHAGLASGLPADGDSTDRLTELEAQLAALTARVDELEKTTAPTSATKRTTRSKTTSETTE